MAAPSTTYEPRCPAQSALYQIVRDHFETFRVQAACLRDGEGLPRFVEQAFQDFLQCGWLAGGVVGFHPTSYLTALDVAEVLATLEPRIRRLLDRRGLGDRDDEGSAPDAWAEDAPVLAGLAAASVQGTVALGRQRGARIARLGDDPPEAVEAPALGRCHARSNGFDLHAGLVVPAGQREQLERVCRYAVRPPVAADRLRVTGDGQVQVKLRHRWTDGTTHLVFDPLEFLGRLAVLVPRPRINLILYHGVLAPRAAWRSEIVRRETSDGGGDAALTDPRAHRRVRRRRRRQRGSERVAASGRT